MSEILCAICLLTVALSVAVASVFLGATIIMLGAWPVVVPMGAASVLLLVIMVDTAVGLLRGKD